jgi:hypothetical protein
LGKYIILLRELRQNLKDNNLQSTFQKPLTRISDNSAFIALDIDHEIIMPTDGDDIEDLSRAPNHPKTGQEQQMELSSDVNNFLLEAAASAYETLDCQEDGAADNPILANADGGSVICTFIGAVPQSGNVEDDDKKIISYMTDDKVRICRGCFQP